MRLLRNLFRITLFIGILTGISACADNSSSDNETSFLTPDTTPPVITLLGTTPVSIELGTPYLDAGATALDNIDGVVAVTTGNPVDVNLVGTYTVTYDAVDAAGNAAVQVTRTVNVTPDVTPPVITLLGATPVTIVLGAPYVDAGATALDNIDGAVVVTTVNPVNVNVAGSYTVTYDAVDAAGNAAIQATRTVNVTVIPDVTPPVITLLGTTPVSIELGTPYVDAGATALDNIDGPVAVTTVDPVDVNVEGSYTVTYDATDGAGNAAIQVTRTVDVTPDVTPPVITLLGTTPVSIELGTPYVDAGATALDNIDGPVAVTTNDPVDVNLVGTYTVTYNATDAAGNPAAQVTRTVDVTPDVTPPVITLTGATPVNIELGTPYVDAGATALDNFDGPVAVTTVDPVDENTLGSYTVTYDATDAAGNDALQVTRTVNVNPVSITSFEIIDPTPGIGDQFGQLVVILANGNVVVTDPSDDNVLINGGAVHIYNPVTKALVASIYGDDPNDQIGLGSITALANNNFVLASPVDNVGGTLGAGTVRLIDGATGAQIGGTIAGDNPADGIGAGGITVLANGNYVISSPYDDVPGFADAGTVQLINGATGAQIGVTIAGDAPGDSLGEGGITALANNNFVISTRFETVGINALAGSVQLVNGLTGVPVVGGTIEGDAFLDLIGTGGVIALPNGNYVIGSPSDNGGIGSVRLVDGVTGVEIPGSLIVGDNAGDNLGYVTGLANSNYVISAPSDDVVGPIANAGSVRLVDGASGVQIGVAIEGDATGDQLGLGDNIALSNNNIVVASIADDEGLVDNGSVRLISGTNGLEIGAIVGDDAGDQLGFSINGITALANDNYVIASDLDDEGFTDNGAVRLVDGSSGSQIGTTIAGAATNDQLGSGGIFALANDDYVIISPLDDAGGVDFGSVRLVDGTTGTEIGTTITGSVAGDVNFATVTGSPAGDYYILAMSFADNIAGPDSGLVRLIVP